MGYSPPTSPFLFMQIIMQSQILLLLIFLFRSQLSYFHPRELSLIPDRNVLFNPLPFVINSYPVTSGKSFSLSEILCSTYKPPNSFTFWLVNTKVVGKDQPFILTCSRLSEQYSALPKAAIRCSPSSESFQFTYFFILN